MEKNELRSNLPYSYMSLKIIESIMYFRLKKYFD